MEIVETLDRAVKTLAAPRCRWRGPLAAAALALGGLASNASLQGQTPNLAPYQPTGWSDKIIVAKAPGTTIDGSPLLATDTLYINWAVSNNGNGATGARFFTDLYVDGTLRATWYTDPPLDPNFYVSLIEGFSIGSLPPGTHTLRIKADSTNAIAESNESDNEYTKTITIVGGGSCSPGATTLCLNNSRFQVRVLWRVPSQGTSGVGNAVTLTGDTGYFWFFSANNVELVLKVVDGRTFNGRYWVFYGALSNVEYTITVTDTQTGTVKTYFNPSGTLASVADTSAFAGGSSPSVARAPVILESAGATRVAAALQSALPLASAACSADSTTLCLNNSRFQVRVLWRVPSQGTSGNGNAVTLTGDTGYFWFFSANNVELIVKAVDGTAFNSRYWVFFGALSNVEYTITVTDTQTGTVKTYFNPSGQLSSVADTSAFSPSSPASAAIDTLKTPDAQARMNHENFPILIRPAAEAYNPEVTQLIVGGPGSVSRILTEFQRPATFLDETPLSLLAYALEKIGDPSAVPVLATWLQQNLFSEVNWATDFVTHTIKVLGHQSGLNTTNYLYTIDQKLDTIAQARAGSAGAGALSRATCSETAADNAGICPQRIIVTGINAQGQQESFTLNYKVASRDLQDIIDAESDPAKKAQFTKRRDDLAGADETNYGGTDYAPVAGSQVSLKSNCGGTVIENIINAIAVQKGFPIHLGQGGSTADEIRALALKFGGEVPLSQLDTFTVISHDGSTSSAHVEVPVQSTATSAVVYSKDNYGLLRQHTVGKTLFSSNGFLPPQRAYGNRPWYQGGATPITTRFYRVDPSRIVSIVVDSSACPCNPTASNAIPVAITQPSASTTDQRVITVAGTVGNSSITSATLKINGSPQAVAVSGGAFSAQIVLRSGDNAIEVDVTAPDGRRGCATKTITSTTPKTTISVTLTWNLDSCDVDLYVTQPDLQTSWYQNKTTSIGGRLDVDNTSGFGPENYFLSSAGGNPVPSGTYTIRAHYYSDHSKTESKPARVVTWRVVILVNEGTPNERSEIVNGSLSSDNSGNSSPGSSGPDWATVKLLNYQP